MLPAPERRTPGIRLLPLVAALAIMLGVTAWPRVLAGAQGGADHLAALALFWAMSAGFVAGVGFRPRGWIWRALFGAPACALGLALAVLRAWAAG